MPSGPKGFSAVSHLAAASLNTADTCQISMNANRMVPPHKPSGPSGNAKIEINDVLDGMPIYSQGTKVTQAARKRLLT